MDDLITQLETMTKGLVERISLAEMEDMEEFVTQRDFLISRIVSIQLPLEERAVYFERINMISGFDSLILSRMNQLKVEAQAGLQKVNLGKVQRGAYEVAYTPDSIFFDRKK
ncbi:flagellar protein FliT [Paenibacillus silviterrae]|uniref:flagellar protein FliT n=1 Tax=Paenibacillus silviterrae TaxID=3242194 RepID=UPI002542C633|nr:flagellar protein FliT [Paenibacillus chinjuensis]